MTSSTELENRVEALSVAFGTAIRQRRTAMGMTQDELALATGVGRRFLIDLEAGKASCQMGRSLLVAEALGMRLTALFGPDRAHERLPDELPPP